MKLKTLTLTCLLLISGWMDPGCRGRQAAHVLWKSHLHAFYRQKWILECPVGESLCQVISTFFHLCVTSNSWKKGITWDHELVFAFVGASSLSAVTLLAIYKTHFFFWGGACWQHSSNRTTLLSGKLAVFSLTQCLILNVGHWNGSKFIRSKGCTLISLHNLWLYLLNTTCH